MALAPTVRLNDGNAIPQIGLGTWPLDDAQVATAVVSAVKLGYRHVDTAYRYGNEAGVGQGVRDCGVPREELFITTKLDGTHQGRDRAVEGLEGSLKRLGLDYVDLLLIHWPLPQRNEFVSTWETFERLQAEGKVRSIGVSNFKPSHLERLLEETSVVPAVNQIQISPSITRIDERAFNGNHGIATESYSPLGAGRDLLNAPVLAAIGKKHGKTPGQVVLRWHVQEGLVAIPKSANPARMKENLDVFGFALDHDDLSAIATLDAGADAGVDSDVQGH
ncbi:aldo/keto reductase [Arthrobacter bambusae]|uniref:2,5-diketo-D-gluconate reductase A n=1 Tax=Arthrobacter bambusae TaxID=1338426 RepID=A0AAW8DMF9_9MICC|nr:aldo/keto reductase [Arthrobacter bambusae]MDP9907519.1 2,5-diketo-D-gluconate reductase A [Arthrobacter bambusae]MDQ0131724.1 2,5-diketo-D-gluconate reductase A [Arthrobacter bambusae]MDQ0183136.1 2,5-diketo-D-gluconate reductase A [Arthrobacter bambusae]